MPVSTGRLSSVAAAKTTRATPLLNSATSTLTETPASTLGMGGKSLASTPVMRASKRRHFRVSVFLAERVISILSFGSVATKSVSSLAGTVVAPSSSTLAPIQQDTAISRLVADSFSRPSSVVKQHVIGDGQGGAGCRGAADDGQPLGKVFLQAG